MSAAATRPGSAGDSTGNANGGSVSAPADSGSRESYDMRVMRGLYLNRFAAQSATKMRYLIGVADNTEINAFVIDIKDEFGLNYRSSDTLVSKNQGKMGIIPNLKALVDTLKAHDIIPIARIVVFKDSVAARVNPSHVIRRPDGTPWRDKPGLTWVNPYDRHIWEYNIRVAEEMARLGFEEIQFDYIRFPEPYKSLPQQIFPGAGNVAKPKILAEFLQTACARIHKLGAGCTADIFGLVTTVPGALEIGQHWETLAPATDVVLPMVYPSHYPRGAFGAPRPNAEPYKVVHAAIKRARERNEKLGLGGRENVRPWLQAFSLGKPDYGANEISEQKRAVYDAGYDGWILWHPGSRYETFVPAFEKTLVSRKKARDSTTTASVPATP
jgi:hypothetical protein